MSSIGSGATRRCQRGGRGGFAAWTVAATLVLLAGCAGGDATRDTHEAGTDDAGVTPARVAADGAASAPDTARPGGGKASPARGRPAPVARHPHDPAAFTQGLFFHDGYLYEGTGRRGQSALRKIEPATGRVVQERRLPDLLFGEGIALHDGHVYQVTWQAGVGFVYELDGLRPVRQFGYRGEGWGLTARGEHLVMSDGSATLRFLEPDGFRTVRRLEVLERGRPVRQLNELELVDGELWANVWRIDDILRIDPDSGEVLARIDLSDLVGTEAARDPEAVLNGIAWDPATDRVYLTGKLWRHVYEYRRADLVAG